MTDQGWMVDDGTCTPCVLGDCLSCTEPFEEHTREGTYRTCCCDDSIELGFEAAQP
jgi:hypothetical protein